VSLFETGQPASDELADLAESGNTAPLADLLSTLGNNVGDVQTIGGLLAPGATATIRVGARRITGRISIAAMLIPTNDTFVAANAERLPRSRGSSTTFYLRAYDAGSEVNDQDCTNIPGPFCGGTGPSPVADDDEGFVHVSNGIHVGGDLTPAIHTWSNPVAKVVITRVR